MITPSENISTKKNATMKIRSKSLKPEFRLALMLRLARGVGLRFPFLRIQLNTFHWQHDRGFMISIVPPSFDVQSATMSRQKPNPVSPLVPTEEMFTRRPPRRRSSGGKPSPWSHISMRRFLPSHAARISMSLPGGEKFIALETRLARTELRSMS